MSHSFACLHHHLVFSTKDRVPLITEPLQPRLYEYIGGIVRECKCRLVAAGGMPDHVHLLIDLSRELSIAETVRLIKSNSSKWIHETFPDRQAFAWQTGYGAFAVSYSNLEKVERYIATQAEYHHKKTFQEEFVAFLIRHKIPYDERYLWE